MHEVTLTYITGRGHWYAVSWKGSEERSGGVVTNIGVHFFDLLLWLFGRRPNVAPCTCGAEVEQGRGRARTRTGARPLVPVDRSSTTCRSPPVLGGKTTFRSIRVDGADVEFSEGFIDLHTRVYEDVLAGRGFGIDDARPVDRAGASHSHGAD